MCIYRYTIYIYISTYLSTKTSSWQNIKKEHLNIGNQKAFISKGHPPCLDGLGLFCGMILTALRGQQVQVFFVELTQPRNTTVRKPLTVDYLQPRSSDYGWTWQTLCDQQNKSLRRDGRQPSKPSEGRHVLWYLWSTTWRGFLMSFILRLVDRLLSYSWWKAQPATGQPPCDHWGWPCKILGYRWSPTHTSTFLAVIVTVASPVNRLGIVVIKCQVVFLQCYAV